MKYLIVGNGPAGTTAAGRMRQLDPEAEITLFSFESLPYYARPRLPEFIAGNVASEKLVIFPEEWYEKNSIRLLLERRVEEIDPGKQVVVSSGEVFAYDKLLLAVGSDPFFPPVEMRGEVHRVFALRTIEDANKIITCAQEDGDVIAVGGGLLGLEVLSSLTEHVKKITVVEMCSSLLPMQLAPPQGERLQRIFEERGFEFRLSAECQYIREENGTVYLELKDGTQLHGSMLIVTAGVRARTQLAASAGVDVGKGVIVDQFMRTSVPNIYAAGDCIELDGKMWGFVKSSMEQGRIAAQNMVQGDVVPYKGTDLQVKLKVSGVDLEQL